MSTEGNECLIDLARVQEFLDLQIESLTGQLVGDLVWLTHPFGCSHATADFDAIAGLAAAAVLLIDKHVDYLISLEEPVEHASGLILWAPSHLNDQGLAQRPTREQLKQYIGEPQLLFDAIEIGSTNVEQSTRLLAAFGVLCCERALNAATRWGAMEMLSAGGTLLASATFMSGCLAGGELEGQSFYSDRSRGGTERHERSKIGMNKPTLHREWLQWQIDRTLHSGNREFCAKMVLKYGDAAPSDPVLRGWMRVWAEELHLSSS